MKKLGIVIPTHNRAVWLCDALESLMPSVALHLEDVCVYVTDNASDDGTGEKVKPFLEKYKGIIEYYYHKEGIPYYENFNWGVSHIEAEYVFLHGDDDLITPYFLDYLLSVLNSEKDIGLIHINYFMSNSLRQYIGNNQSKIDFDHPVKRYPTGKALLLDYYNSTSFMGANVFLKQNWVKYMKDKESPTCYGYEWLYVLLKGSIEKPAVYVELPLFVQRFSNTNNYSDRMPLYILCGLFRVFEYIDKDLYDGWRKYVKKERKWDYYKAISRVNLNRLLYKKHYMEIRRYITGWDGFLLYLCVYIIPPFFSNNVIFRYFKMRSRFENIKKYRYFV